MAIDIIVHPGVDSALIAWRSSFIDKCRGFALYRKIKRAPGSVLSPNTVHPADADGFAEEIVASWVGFADGPNVKEGTRKPTTEWPIQKYLWSDFAVNQGDIVAYRVSAMIGTEAALQESHEHRSGWSEPMEIGAETDGRVSSYFNRGIVASQWLARALPGVSGIPCRGQSDGNEGDHGWADGRNLRSRIACWTNCWMAGTRPRPSMTPACSTR